MTALRALLGCLLAASAAQADPAAWRVSDAAGNEVVVLGSVHYLRERDHPLPARVDALYAEAERLVMELDLDDIDPLQLQSALLEAAMLPAGDRLSEVVDADVYKLAREQARTLGVELALLDGFEPWLVAITLLDLGMGQLGYRAEHGLEQHLLRRALRDGKPIDGLETLATQVAVFDALGRDEQQALLEQTLHELDAADAVMAGMIGAWREGELDSLAASLMAEFDAFPALYDALVVDRNNAWVAELESLLRDGAGALVIVGALHLVGEDSLVELLRARGLRVTLVE